MRHNKLHQQLHELKENLTKTTNNTCNPTVHYGNITHKKASPVNACFMLHSTLTNTKIN